MLLSRNAASNKKSPYHCGWEAISEATVLCTSTGQHLGLMYGDIYAYSAPSMCTWYSLSILVSGNIITYVPTLVTGMQRRNENQSGSGAAAKGEPAHCLKRGNKCAYTNLQMLSSAL